MKVLAISGSARIKGNTEILLQRILNKIHAVGMETELVSFAGETIAPCRACFACGGRGNCMHKNDYFNKIFDKVKEADAMNRFFLNHEMIVVGSTYWNIAYGQMSGDVLKDEEGLSNMDNLAENMIWLLQKTREEESK